MVQFQLMKYESMAYDQKPQKFTINVFTLYSHNMSALYCAVQLKEAHRLLLSGLVIDNKDSFERSRQVCLLAAMPIRQRFVLCYFPKPPKRSRQDNDSQQNGNLTLK